MVAAMSRRVAVLFLALQVASAFRMHKQASRLGVKHIAGVPVYNSKQASYLGAEGRTDWTLMLKPDVSEEQLQSFCEGSSITCIPEGHAGGVPFVEALCSEAELEELLKAHSDLVAFAEPDFEMKIIPEKPAKTLSSASAASWGLDRVGVGQSSKGGQGVHVYVLDTGVHTTHNDFGGRAIPTLEVTSSSPQECQGSTSCAKDVHGHGTHCAGTVGGTTYGVAPKSSIHGVKVLSDEGWGEGSWTVSAIDWVMTKGERPAVISMSLGAPGTSQADKVAIDRATNAGVTVVVAAGNENSDACRFTPAFVPSAITVGSTASGDSRSWFSNYGTCVNIYAPGSDIKSAGHRSNSGSATMSGTSMACPHVSGAAALLLESNPDWKSTQVLSTMLSKAVSGAISDLRSGDTNKLLWVGDGAAPSPAPTPAPIGDCVDTDNGAKDPYGDSCAEYAFSPSWCGQYDSSSFNSGEMCCACGGGQTNSFAELEEIRHKQDVEAKFIAGVPVHNYQVKDRSSASDWIVMLKAGTSQDQLETFCSNSPSGSRCTPEGHAGIIPFVELHGTESDLKEVLEGHSDDVEFVEPDFPTHLIPELPVAQNTVTRYLPIFVDGTVRVLFPQDGSSWLVSDKELGGNYAGLGWRLSKDMNDRDGDSVAWGTVLQDGVEEDGWVKFEVPVLAPWGLERVGVEKAATKGKGVHIYVLDTGVRTTHTDFGGRAIPTLEYVSTSPTECKGSTSCARDVHGHGTHCAGSAGGTTYGVAPESTIHGVKVLSDQGYGSTSWIVGAIDWVVAKGERPAVVSMSLGGSGRSSAYKTAIDTASNSGVTVVVAAGNENSDACNYSPAYVLSAITVGSTAQGDSRSSFSNYGSCVQIYAPGSSIKSAGNANDDASATMSGTSMACPHVAGGAALLLESTPNMPSTQVLQTLLSNAVSDSVTGLTSSCPNKLLYVGASMA